MKLPSVPLVPITVSALGLLFAAVVIVCGRVSAAPLRRAREGGAPRPLNDAGRARLRSWQHGGLSLSGVHR